MEVSQHTAEPTASVHSAGFSEAQPVHLLLALCDLTPLPTVLYNPLVWLLGKTQGRSSPATSVLFDVRPCPHIYYM
jgi:hypothetical protein